MTDTKTWSVYIIRAADNSLYTGIATDVPRRLREHEAGRSGARYLRGRAPLTLVYQQEVGDRSLALRVEYAIKQLRRHEKQALVMQAPDTATLLRSLAMEPPIGDHDGVDHAG